MASKNLKWWLLGGVVVWLLSRTAKAAMNLQYSIAGFSFAQNGFDVILNLRITNNDSAAVPLLHTVITGSVTLNNSAYLGNVRGDVDAVLPGGSSIVVPIGIMVQPDLIAGGVAAVMAILNKADVRVTMNGIISVAGLGEPFQVEYNVY